MSALPRIALILLLLILCCLLFCASIAWVGRAPSTLPIEQLADPDSLFVDVRGLQVHYKVAGQGEPTIILLHGFAASVFSWRGVMQPLAEVGTVMAFDRPAFGLTERPMPGEWAGESPYSPEAQADLTVALMDELEMEKAVLVGHSAGGTIAVLTALRYPERVEALVLEDAAVYDYAETPEWVAPSLRTAHARWLGSLLVRSITLWGEIVIREAWSDPNKITVELISDYKKPLQAENWDRALWEVVVARHPLALEERLDEVSVPALVITGERDNIVPPRNSERLASELPAAQLAVIPDCGHVPHEECAGPFLREVNAFLAALP